MNSHADRIRRIQVYRRIAGALRHEVAGAAEALRLARRWHRLRAQPKGQGQPVMVIPGFMTGDAVTLPLRAYLKRQGYAVSGWGLGRNTEEIEAREEEIVAQVARFSAQHGGVPVMLVGWSLGGLVAREVARLRPDLVDRVVTLGSPVHGPENTMFASIFPQTQLIAARIRRKDREQPISVPVFAMYSETDVFVYKAAVIDKTGLATEHIQVSTTHLGMGLAPEVYARIASILSADLCTACAEVA